MSSNNNEQSEPQGSQDTSIEDFTTSYIDFVNEIAGVLPRIRNLNYNAQTNTTTVYGHTNFEELNVYNSPVALQSQIPDISTKANTIHTHNINDIYKEYEEEEEFQEEEEVNGEMTTVNKTRTITRSVPLDNILTSTQQSIDIGLAGKANSTHTHSISDITNLSTTLSGKANSTHTHTTNDISFPYEYTATMWDSYHGNQEITMTGTIPISDILTYDYVPNSSSNSLQLTEAIESTKTIIGTNVLANNETRLAAVETLAAGKASSTHTHTCADITNISSTYAKLTGANTFTNTQTITKKDGLNVNLTSTLANSTYTRMTIGDNTKSASIGLAKEANGSYNAFLKIMGQSASFAVWSNKFTMNNVLEVPSITLNGNDLETTLSGKANSTHTHTCADITDISSTYAKLAGANTFTNTQTITKKDGLSVNITTALANSGATRIKIGDNTKSTVVGLSKDSNGVYFGYFKIMGESASLEARSNKFVMTAGLDVPSITLNGTDLATTLNNCAKLNDRNTFRATDCYFLNPLQNPTGSFQIGIGRNWGELGTIQYTIDSNNTQSFFIGLSGGGLTFLADKITSNRSIELGEYSSISCGAITISGSCTATSFVNSSDIRKKENINKLTTEQSDQLINNVKVYSFNFKDDKDKPKRLHYGVIAQELQKIAPELVYDDGSEEHYLSVNYTELIPHLINKIHLQDKRINELESKLNKLVELIGFD